MAKRKYEDMWGMLSKYQFTIDQSDMNDLACALCKGILINACQGTCGCRYCRCCIDQYLQDGPKKCIGTKPECQEDNLNLFTDIHADNRANISVATLKVPCVRDGCPFRTELGMMIEHIRVCGVESVGCLFHSMGCDSAVVTTDTMAQHLNQESVMHTELLLEWMGNVKNELYEGTRRVATLEEEVKRLHGEVERQGCVIESQRGEIETQMAHATNTVDIIGRMSLLEGKVDQLITEVNGQNEFLWKVDKMREKIDEARAGIRSVVFSQPFYTHKHGYKLRLSMHPNGYGRGESTHLYVLFSVMKGDYDDMLSWPMVRVVTLGIVDRNTGNDHCRCQFALAETNTSLRGAFAKPSSNENSSMGNDKFVLLEHLVKYQNLLRDDVLFIRCTW